MARIKETISVLTRDQIDSLIGEYARLKLELDGNELTMKRKIEAAKKLYKDRETVLTKRLKEIETTVYAHVRSNWADFIKPRSIRLVFGTIGMRATDAVDLVYKSKDAVLNALKALREFPHFEKCIRVKEEVDLEEVKKLSDVHLAQIGIARKPVIDEPYFDPDFDKVDQPKP